MSARKAEMLASAESHLEQSEYGQAVDVAREYLAVSPGDNDMRSMLARSLFAAEHPGPASIIPAAVVAEWPATDCVESIRADDVVALDPRQRLRPSRGGAVRVVPGQRDRMLHQYTGLPGMELRADGHPADGRERQARGAATGRRWADGRADLHDS